MKRLNIAEIGCEIEIAVPDSTISYGSDQSMLPEKDPQGYAASQTLRISFDGNTFADEGNGLFVFQPGSIFV